MKYAIVSVDFQNSYLLKDQEFYSSRPGLLSGIVRNLYPLLKKYDIQVHQIMSDYRAPSKEHKIGCQPGTIGFLSGLNNSYCTNEPFYKANISPLWQRKNIGQADMPTEEPYLNASKFYDWVNKNFGSPSDIKIILIGIGIESSMFATAKEFSMMGYDVYFLYEACDTIRHNKAYKKLLFENSPLLEYVGLMTYKKLKHDLRKQGVKRVIFNNKQVPQGLDFFSRTNNEVSINKTPNPDIEVYAKQATKTVAADITVGHTQDKAVSLKISKDPQPFMSQPKPIEKVEPKKVDYIDEYVPPSIRREPTYKPRKPRRKPMDTMVTQDGNVSVHDKYMREIDIKRIEKSMQAGPAKAKRKVDDE